MEKSTVMISNKIEVSKQAWTTFMETGIATEHIHPAILESWKRCKTYQVDPMGGKGEQLPEEEYTKILKRKTELIEVAKSIMVDLHHIVKDTSNAIVLTDENGVILETIWNKLGLHRKNELNFVKGCQWTEKNVGTNAIGTALHLDEPIQTLGSEHYCSLQHSWTCSAAPIHNNEGDLIGIIDISGDYDDYHPHSLGMVVAAADAIENQLKIIEHRKWLNVAYDSIQDGLLILNTKYEVKDYNTRLCKILGISKEDFATINIQELLKDVLKDQNIFDSKAVIAYRETSLYLDQQRIECGITISPVLENELCLGTVIAVKELELVRSVVNKVAGNSACYTFNHILTKSANMENLIQLAKKTAKNDCPVLIQGESGTGKELFAHAIHSSSARSQAPFVAVNCAALPKDLVESELFGYAKGAFTGALKEGKPGKFELANGGTIFLDEIGELPLEVQAKLLRVLDNYTVTRIGGNFERALDIRVIAATNRDLADEITKHNFRSDLFYRLNVLRLFLHPLRERPGDITYCAECFLERLNKKSKEADKYYDASFLDAIESYEWKGNLRELQNIVQRAFYISEDQQISVDMLPDSIVSKESPSLPAIAPVQTIDTRIKTLEEMEIELLSSALTQCSGNVVAASKMINIGKSTFYRKLKEYHIDYSQIGKN